MNIRRIVSFLLLMAILGLCLASCSDAGGKDDSTAATTTEVTEAPEDAILLYDGEEVKLQMVVPEGSGKELTTAFFDLKAKLEDIIGEKIKNKDDFARDDEIKSAKDEILVGRTNRPATKEALESISLKMTYTVVVNKNGVVLVGNSLGLTLKAIEYFADEYLPQNLVKSGEAYYIKCGAYVGEEEKDASFVSYAVMYYLAGEEFKYDTATEYLTIPRIEGHYIQQGACLDDKGKYAYFALRDKNDNCSIAKYDFTTKELIMTKANVGANHANDMCYNPNNNTVLISNCTNFPTVVSIYNADDLSLIRHKDIGLSNSAIDYNAKRNQYVICGGGQITILDENFKKVRSFKTQPVIHVSQGMNCDDEYIYCFQSDNTKNNEEAVGNVIYIYDWDGNFIFKMKFPDISTRRTMEAETMMNYGSDLYAVCYDQKNKCGVVHKMTFTVPEQ